MRRVFCRPVALVGVAAVAGLLGSACGGGEQASGSGAEATTMPARVYALGDVRRQFRLVGLPLIDLGGTSALRMLESRPAGPVFHVDVYPSIAAAAENDGVIFYLKPARYRVRGEVMTGRRGNVVVIFESGRGSVSEGVRTALERLG